MVAECEGSAPPIPNPTIRHGPEPLLCTPPILKNYSLRSILILSFHYLLDISTKCFLKGFPTILYAFLMSPFLAICTAYLGPCRSHDPNVPGDLYKSRCTSLCNILLHFLHPS